MWLPTELWVDAFKMLARRDLVQRVQPTCRRMHAICERHVHSIHPILEFYTFLDALVSNAPEAHKQLADLRASNANLFAHFELCSVIFSTNGGRTYIKEKNKNALIVVFFNKNV